MNFNAIPRRDAHATFAGYVYQVNVSILRWLELVPGEHLELEAGEDIDLVQTASEKSEQEKERLLEQLKQESRSITLRNPDSLEALANCCQHLRANPDIALRFRFLTTAPVAKERAPWAASQPGIELWEDVRQGRLQGADRIAALGQLRNYLQQCPRPAQLSSEKWTAFQEVLSESEIWAFGKVVDTFEWATKSENHEAVEQIIREALQARDPEHSESDARIQYRNLFTFVIKLLTQKGRKELNRNLLNRELTSTSMTLDDHLSAATLRSWIARVDARLEDHESRLETLERRSSRERISTFYVPSPQARSTGSLFDFNQTLRGRNRRLEALTVFVNDNQKRISVLPGRGGIGKTKLLRDWGLTVQGWQLLWVNQHGAWSENSATEIPNQDAILIADNAHHYSDLEKLVDYVATATSGARLKLVIATRPSGQAYVDEILARAADESLVQRFETLREPGPDASLEIAKEVLGASFEHFAEALANVSRDTPLVTVVGGRLIARGQIGPELLANDIDFRNTVFRRFAEECEGILPTGGRTRRELLYVIAAVQPVREQDDQFADRAAAFLSIRPDQVWQGLDDLENRGVLVRGRGGVRIAPDLFGDYLLESASVNGAGVTTGFADAVFTAFEGTHLSNLLKNFAELDWRITQRNPESRLLDSIWVAIYARFRGQDAAERERFLREVAGIAVFQPARVEELTRIAMEEPVEPIRVWNIRRITQEHILRQLSPLLGVTIFHESTSRDAFNRLWMLAQHGSDEVYNPARRALKEAIAYHKYKNVAYNERFFSFVEERALDETAYQGSFTPLTLIDEILEREVDDTSLRGRAFSFTALPVNYPVIKGLRERGLNVLDHVLHSPSPRLALAAAGSLAHVIAEFHPKLRAAPTAEEQEWQDKERLKALSLLEQRIQAGHLPLPLVWRLRRLFRWVGRRDAQSAEVKSKAAELLASLPVPEFIDLFYVMCTNEYEDGTMEFDSIAISAWRQELENAGFAELDRKCPDPEAKIAEIERLIRNALDAGVEPERLEIVLTRLCRELAFLESFSGYLVRQQSSLLASQANFSLNAWRDVDPEKYIYYGAIFARSTNLRMARAAAMAVSYGPPLQNPIPQDLALLALLSRRTEGYVLGDVLVGLRRLMRITVYESAAAELYANIRIGNDRHLAKHYCDTVGAFRIPSGIFNSDQAERMFTNLIEVDELDSDSVGGLLAGICGIAPLAIVRFFQLRIERWETLNNSGADSDYKPIPSSFSWSALSAARENSEYPGAVAAFIALMHRYPDSDHYLAPIFWHMAELDIPTLSALDELLHSDNSTDHRLLNYLVHEGPKGLCFSQPMFAMHVLAVSYERSEEAGKNARRVLFTNAVHGHGMQVFAGTVPPPLDMRFVSPAQSLSALWAEGSLPHTFYAELAQIQQPVLPRPMLDEDGPEDDDDQDLMSATET